MADLGNHIHRLTSSPTLFHALYALPTPFRALYALLTLFCTFYTYAGVMFYNWLTLETVFTG
jgi:hypothetical protein